MIVPPTPCPSRQRDGDPTTFARTGLAGPPGRRPASAYTLSVWILLADQVLMNAGYYMLFPMLTVHLTRDLGFDATAVGLLLAARILVQQGSAPLGGALSDRVGYKPVIVAGFAVRTIGFLWYALAQDLMGVLAGTLITSAGGALFDPPSRAALAHLTPERQRQSIYASAGMAAWIGQILGPLVGALLLPFSFTAVSLAAAGTFLVAAVQAAVFLPGSMRGEVGNLSLFRSIGAAMRDREFARFTGLLLGFHFLMVQMVITVPLLTSRIAGPSAIGVIFAIQAGLGLLLQVPVARWVARRMGSVTQVALGMLLTAVGFAGYALAADLPGLALCTMIAAIGQLLVMPAQSLVTARLAGGQGGAYFGVGALAIALGGALGNSVGGLMVDVGDRVNAPWAPWAGMALVAAASALGFLRLAGDPHLRGRLQTRPARVSDSPGR